jgi:protein TonB
MKNQSPDLDALIFEGRNTSYGAYLLRKIYPDNLLKSFLWAHLLFSVALLGPVIYEKLSPKSAPEEPEIALVDPKMIEPPPIDPKTPPPPPLPSAPPPPQVSTIRFVPPEVAPDEEILEEDPPKQEDLKSVQTAAETVEGDPTADPNELSLDNTGAGDVIGGPPAEDSDEPFLMVDQMPEFPEGDVQSYFAKHLKYPHKAIQMEVSGKVFVSFVVLQDGSLTNIEVMKGLGAGLDEEAVRVIKGMPKWIPGKQGGRPVKVKIIQPIRFSL